jgi:RNA polymerase sigma-70 factor (ECF subfamily)
VIVHWAWPATGVCKKTAQPATTSIVGEGKANPAPESSRDGLYREAAETYGAALDRLARAYEADAEIRRDLLQEIHIALWRSFAGFDARCSLRTWVYRVAHNAATSHVIRQRRMNSRTLVSLEEVDAVPARSENELAVDERRALDRLLSLVQRLKPLDRQVILSYLEGMDAASIGEITGISPGNVATKIHRIKSILARQFHAGGQHVE